MIRSQGVTLWAKLAQVHLDAFLVYTKINRQYLSGFTGSSGILLITKKDMHLFVDGRYALRAKKETKVPVHPWKNVIYFVKSKKLKRLGIEDNVTLKDFYYLKKFIRNVSWIVTREAIEQIRAVKTDEEIKYLTQGSLVIDKVFLKLKALLGRRRNVTETELSLEIVSAGKQLGAEDVSFDPIVAFGPNAAIPHHLSSNTKIGKNNFLLLDYGFKVNGYHSDFTRTLFLGKPTAFHRKIYEIVLEAQNKSIAVTSVGAKASDVDFAARDFIRSMKYGTYYPHNGGHGVGLEIHELPNFSINSSDILKEDMVVTVEP